jgi:rhomboid protease GluP
MSRFGIPRKFTLTYVIIALNVLVYVYTAVLSGNAFATSDAVLLQYGQVNESVMKGSFWQLFTSMFIHVNIEHLLGNMVFLLIFGLRAEEFFETKQYLLIYLMSGLAGNLLSLLLPEMISAGASGCIFGVFGAVTIYMRRAISQSILGALVFSFFLLVISAGYGVNILAHLGGLVAGLLIGYLLAGTRKAKPAYQFSYKYAS